MFDWYTSLGSQLRWEFYCDLIDIVRPTMADFRATTVLNDMVETDPKDENKPIKSAPNRERSD